MEGPDILNQLPREVKIMYERVSKQLRDELDTLPLEKVVSVLEALNKLHRAMESEVYELALRLIQASH
jgi:predicted nucleotidyltransferase